MDIQNFSRDWYMSTEPFDLPENTVHVWMANVERASGLLKGVVGKNVTAGERARAESMQSSIDRDYFIIGRGVLRDILSRYVHQAPADIDFSYGTHGKPMLRPHSSTSRIDFSVSRTEDLALFAVTRTGGIGVDAERLKPCGRFDKIAERYFSAPEIQALRAFPPDLRRDEFLAYWTRKEAFSKALGMGLQIDWASFDVSRVPAQAVQIFEPGGKRWSIHPFLPALGYVGALAHEASCPILKFWKWLPWAPASRLIEPPGARVSSISHVVDLMSTEEISV